MLAVTAEWCCQTCLGAVSTVPVTSTFKVTFDQHSWINKSAIMHLNVLSRNNSLEALSFSLFSYTICNHFQCIFLFLYVHTYIHTRTRTHIYICVCVCV